jgi:hypothetical protein
MEQQHSRASVFGHVADIIDEAGVKQPANRVRAWDVIVASAGHISVPKALENSNTEEWWRSFEVTKPQYCANTLVANVSVRKGQHQRLPNGHALLAPNSATQRHCGCVY